MSLRVLALHVLVLLAIACSASPQAPVAALPHPATTLSLTYLGVAGWRIAVGEHVLLVDPYFSRIDPSDDDEPIASDEAILAKTAPTRADVIVVGHSHYDHLLDVPWIAKRTGASVVGTPSTLNVARASGVDEAHLAPAPFDRDATFGPFAVRAFHALHSLIGMVNKEIPRDVRLPMSADAYGEGGTLQYMVRAGGKSVFFVTTANLIDREIDGLRPDVAVIATGARSKVPDYACRMMRALGNPKLVFTNHFDALRQPLGPKQMDIGDDGRASLAAFEREVHACSPETRVVVPTHLREESL